ncbi:MAG: pyrroline-5-carboxylate reductase [Arenimonas sp. SCN 70-307]|uniref:pyrroline-5-carboxylate reductase n=1 Tax=Arenimonas sp. SCN 70-307 TaxID=1660089 RepID=UPI00086F596F|nr:pyrroline-5-carboxylate reductase [Arenimonas sp. SCN 70-307]ODS62941.1 MAG: pyrroline-5-carboxylate reductase [Arenimonas sp. SCN 70-307]
MTMEKHGIAFIGGGNMARSLIGGLVARGHAPAALRVAEPVAALREALAADFGVSSFEAAPQAAEGAGTWLLAVKPQVMKAVCESLAPLAQAQRPLVVSIAAGVTAGQIEAWLGGGQAVVRSMPNTPALLGAGATGLFANARVDADGRAAAEALMGAAGLTAWIGDEALMDAVTAVSGSGPAYVFLLAEAMQAAGEAQGLAPDTARTLVLQTILGAARMLSETGEPAATLRQRVTSPGGTTQAAIESFEGNHFRRIVHEAITAATERGRQLSAG